MSARKPRFDPYTLERAALRCPDCGHKLNVVATIHKGATRKYDPYEQAFCPVAIGEACRAKQGGLVIPQPSPNGHGARVVTYTADHPEIQRQLRRFGRVAPLRRSLVAVNRNDEAA